jgi:hypothetical protein
VGSTRPSLLAAPTRGALAGAVGLLAMDLLWYARHRKGGGKEAFYDWEFSTGATRFDDVGAPAQVGRRMAREVLGRDLPPESAALTSSVVHWATGVQWGALYGLGAAVAGRPRIVRSGGELGAVAWATSYIVLGAIGVYQPIWEYDTVTLADDLSAHLVFGVGTAAAYRLLASRSS